jgi:hypothetical protein
MESPVADIRNHRLLHGWILDWLGRLEEKELGISILLIYQMWLARNEAREETQIVSPEELVWRTIFLFDEWANIQASKPRPATREVEAWLPPDVGWVKANADGAFLVETGHGGSGVVLRDHHGGFVAGASHFFPSTPDPERTELLACKQALILAKERDVQKVCLESDCLDAISKLRSDETDRSMHGPLVEEIKSLL